MWERGRGEGYRPLDPPSWAVPEAEPWSRLRIVLVALLVGTTLGIGIAFLTPLMTIMALLGLAFGLSILAWPELGLLAFVAVANLLPYAVIPVRFGLSLTLVDAVLTTLLVSWIFHAIHRGRPLVASNLSLPILLYIGLALTSFVLGLTYSISPERFRLFIKSLNSILLFFSVINCVRTRAELKRAVGALLLCGSASAAVALALQFLPATTAIRLLSALGPFGYPTGPQVLRPIADTEILRAIGTSIDPNVLGGLMMTISALLVGQIFSPAPVLSRRLLWPMVALTVAALLLTYSRTALGGFVVAAMMVATFRYRRVWILMLGLAVALPFLPQGEVFVSRLQSGLAFEDRAALMRLGEYKDAFNLIAMYPWFGIGFGEPPSIDLYLGVSSMYLLLGQEMGLVGLTSFLVVLGLLAWTIACGLEAVRDQELRGLLLTLAAALVAATTAGVFDHYFANILFPHMVALFWLYVGLAVAAAKLARNERVSA